MSGHAKLLQRTSGARTVVRRERAANRLGRDRRNEHLRKRGAARKVNVPTDRGSKSVFILGSRKTFSVSEIKISPPPGEFSDSRLITDCLKGGNLELSCPRHNLKQRIKKQIHYCKFGRACGSLRSQAQISCGLQELLYATNIIRTSLARHKFD